MTRLTFVGLAASMATALLLTAPAPATADTIIWQPASCATGEITQHAVDTSTAVPEVTIAGWIQPTRPCLADNEEQPNGFAVMFHTPNANFITALLPYESLDAPTHFTMTVPYSPSAFQWWTDFGGLRGLCLVRSYEHRLSCVAVEPGPDGAPHVAPESPDHAELQAPIFTHVAGHHRFIEPSCGTCASPGLPIS